MKYNNASDTPYITSWLWKTGIALWISGVAFTIVYFHFNPETDQLKESTHLLNRLQLPKYVVLILTLITAPVLEEFAFRFWTKGKLISKIVSHGLIVMFLALSGTNIFVTATASILLFVIFYVIKPTYRYSAIINAVVTSVIFGLIHWSNYTLFQIQAAAVMQTMGVGLILSYIGLKYRFVFCIVVHFLYNLVAVSVTEYRANDKKNIVFSGTTYTAELKAKGLFEKYINCMKLWTDTIYYEGTLQSIVSSIASEIQNTDIIYFESKHGSPRHKLSVSAKEDTAISYNELLNSLLANTNVKSDTVYKNTISLILNDTVNLLTKMDTAIDNNYFNNHIQSLMHYLKDEFGVPIVLEKQNPNFFLKSKLEIFKIKDFEEMKAFLYKEHKIELIENPQRKIMCITFY